MVPDFSKKEAPVDSFKFFELLTATQMPAV